MKFFVAIIALLLIGLEVFAHHNDYCVTPDCIHTASKLLKNMNPDIDPCNDFYEFACGNFINETIIPDDKVSVSTYGLIREMLVDHLRLIMQKPETSSHLRSFRLVHQLYKSCMDTETIEKRGVEPLTNILNKTGGWPVLMAEKWDAKDFAWAKKIVQYSEYGFGVGGIFRLYVGVSAMDPNKRIIEIDQAATNLPREFLMKGLKDKMVSAYFKFMVKIATFLGADKQAAKNELSDVLNFEMKLAEISLPREKRRNASLLENPTTIAQLQQHYAYVDWLWYLQAIIKHPLTVDEVINVNVPDFFKKLEDVLAQTPERTIANYLAWKMVVSTLSSLTKEVRDIQLEFAKETSGLSTRPPRWKECSGIANNYLDIAGASMYVRRFFKEEAKLEALDMVGYVRRVFQKALTDVTWMDTETKKIALEKLSKMHAHIAYPDELLDDAKIEEYYKMLNLDENLFTESMLNVTLFDRHISTSRLRQPVNRTDWRNHGSAAVVNAFYNPQENSIEFPSGIFQGIFFSSDRPRYLNYGCIGFTIGHEITHGFDDQGRQYNSEGRLVDWWAPDTKEAFLEKTKCIIEQYNSFVAPGTNQTINGFNTQGENIADLGGVKYAYKAYQSWVKDHGPEPQLPGLNYTPEQMFWLSAANKWCSVYKLESLKNMVVVDPHSPAQFRINGPFRNIPEFSKDFNCPAGSNMNPEKKCTIW